MDSYSFYFKGIQYHLARARGEEFEVNGNRIIAAHHSLTAACAEILRLAEERNKFKRWAEEECGKAARAQHDADEARAEREQLIGANIRAGEAEDALRGLESERHADDEIGRRVVEMIEIVAPHRLKGEHHNDALRRIIRERQELTNIRDMYRTAFRRLNTERIVGESADVTLARIIREREQWESAALAEHSLAAQIQKGAETVGRQLAAVERENRSKCLELAEKAGEIRELREQLKAGGAMMRLRCYLCSKSVSTPVSKETVVRAILECPECIQRQDDRAAKLLALLDNEEPPEGLLARFAPGTTEPLISWRWFREVAER